MDRAPEPSETPHLSEPAGAELGGPTVRRNQPHQYVVLAVLLGGVLLYAISTGAISRQAVIFFSVLVPSIILHEVSHGAVALLFGDRTAQRAGRLTLNPLQHIDPFWTILLPAMMTIIGGRAFGMAKPVPVNPAEMRSPRNHSLLTSLAGPATNLLIAAIATVTYRTLWPQSLALRGYQTPSIAQDVVLMFGLANIILAVFNLIPIPPLDGSAVLERFLPRQWLVPYLRLRKYSFFVFIGLFFFGGDIFGRLIQPAVDLWARVLNA
jgi:Zn-dependent protease